MDHRRAADNVDPEAGGFCNRLDQHAFERAVAQFAVQQPAQELLLGACGARKETVELRGAFTRVAIGLVLGAPLAVGAGYLLSSQLYGISFWDPVALSVAAAALAFAASLASS